ncbi:MAG: tetratricopeptide repeat protein [Phycisphaeraceae bacterium JB051]
MKEIRTQTLPVLLLILLLQVAGCSNSQHVKVTLPAKQADPQRAAQLNEDALLKLEEDKPREAIALLKKAIAADPQSVRSHNNLGKIYYQLEQYSDALNMFNKALERDTLNSPQPHNNLAMIYERADKHALAIEHYTRAHELAPDNIVYTANLARALHRRGDRDEKLMALLDEISLNDARPNWQLWAKTEKALILSQDAISE